MTSVFVLAVAAVAVHAVALSVPDVPVGGTVGIRVSNSVPSETVGPALGVVFVLGTELLVSAPPVRGSRVTRATRL